MEFSSRRARDQLRYRRAGTAVGEAGCDDDHDVDDDTAADYDKGSPQMNFLGKLGILSQPGQPPPLTDRWDTQN